MIKIRFWVSDLRSDVVISASRPIAQWLGKVKLELAIGGHLPELITRLLEGSRSDALQALSLEGAVTSLAVGSMWTVPFCRRLKALLGARSLLDRGSITLDWVRPSDSRFTSLS